MAGELQKFIVTHPKVLFVIRAHPDEGRKGKTSRETVAIGFNRPGWIPAQCRLYRLKDYVSSYELVQRSNLVLVYNSLSDWKLLSLGSGSCVPGKFLLHAELPNGAPADSQAVYFSWMEELLQEKAGNL